MNTSAGPKRGRGRPKGVQDSKPREGDENTNATKDSARSERHGAVITEVVVNIEDQEAYVRAYADAEAGDYDDLDTAFHEVMGAQLALLKATIKHTSQVGFSAPKYAKGRDGQYLLDKATGNFIIVGWVENRVALRAISSLSTLLGVTGKEQKKTPLAQGRGEALDHNAVLDEVEKGKKILDELK